MNGLKAAIRRHPNFAVLTVGLTALAAETTILALALSNPRVFAPLMVIFIGLLAVVIYVGVWLAKLRPKEVDDE